MAEPMIIPAWMSREYADPATTFLNAFKTGAAISEMQQKLAATEHQNQVSAQLQREKIQQEALQSQAQLAATQAYRAMTNRMEQAKLEETKKQHIATGIEAALRLKELTAHNMAMEGLTQQLRDVQAVKSNEPKSLNASGVIYERDPGTGEWVPKTERPEKELTATIDPLTGEEKVSGPLSAMRAYKKEQEAAAKAESEKKAQAQPAKGGGFLDWMSRSQWNPYREEATTSKRIRVKSPSGKIGTVSEENLDEALKEGYSRAD